jgi:hypothetical protein
MVRFTATSQATVLTMIEGAQSILSMPGAILVHPTETAAATSPDIDLSGLIPPPGSLYGTRTLRVPSFQWELPPWLVPNGQGAMDPQVDDKLLWNRGQTTNNSTQTTLYVYWVNGGSTPYYCVIAASNGTMNPGAISGGVNNGSCDGYFQYKFTVSADIIKINDAPPPTTGWSRYAASPSSATSDAARAQIAVPMALYAKTDGGMGLVNFTASVDDVTPFTGWQVVPAPDGSGVNGAQWAYQQYSPWAPGAIEDFAYSQSPCFNSGGVVVPLSDGAFGSVFFEAYTVWYFNSPLFTPPANPLTTAPSLPISLNFKWFVQYADIHDPAGCNGAYGYNGYHCYRHFLGGDYAFRWDLAHIVGQSS